MKKNTGQDLVTLVGTCNRVGENTISLLQNIRTETLEKSSEMPQGIWYFLLSIGDSFLKIKNQKKLLALQSKILEFVAEAVGED